MWRFLGGVTAGLAVGVAGLSALSTMSAPPDAVGQSRVATITPAGKGPGVVPRPASAPNALQDDAPAAAEAAPPSTPPIPGSGNRIPEAPAAVTEGSKETPQVAAAAIQAAEAPEQPTSPTSGIAPAVEGVGSQPTAPEAFASLASTTAIVPPSDDAPPSPTAAPQPAASAFATADPAPEPLLPGPAPEVGASVASPRPVGPDEVSAIPARDVAEHGVAEPATPVLPAAETDPETVPGSPTVPEVVYEGPAAPGPAPNASEVPAPSPEMVARAQPRPAAPGSEPAPDALPDQEAPAEPAPVAAPARIRIGGTALPGRNAVPVNRPGLEPAADEPPVEPAPEATSGDAPALQRFAAPWEPPAESRPLMAFVLLDDGAAAPEALAGLPVPVSVALDPSAPGAADRMAALRTAGLEVLALASLPPNPQPTDVEVFLTPALQALPEAVGVLDLGQGGLRGRDATAQMAQSRLAQAGLGAVLVSGGLGRGAEGAEAAGVPAAEILRDLDGAGQGGGAILRQLDDAARRARQEGEAVLLVRPSPATLQALAAWTRERDAKGVAVAPVSAVLSP